MQYTLHWITGALILCLAVPGFGQGWVRVLDTLPRASGIAHPCESGILLAGGGYALTGKRGGDSIYILKTDADGEIAWVNYYLRGYRTVGLAETSDQGIAVGLTEYIYGDSINPALIRVDSNGQLVFDRNYYTGAEDWASKMLHFPDDRYLVASLYNAENTLLKCDAGGAIVEAAPFKGSTLVTVLDPSHYLAIAADSMEIVDLDFKKQGALPLLSINTGIGWALTSAVVSGGAIYLVYIQFLTSTPNGARIQKFDLNGQLVRDSIYWKELDVLSGANFTAVTSTAEGGIFIAGAQSNTLTAIKLDSALHIQWTRTTQIALAPGFDLQLRSVAQTPDGGYILFGDANSNGLRKPVLIKTDSNGLIFPNLFNGRVVDDQNLSCAAEGSEPGLERWFIEIGNLDASPFRYASTNPGGEFRAELPKSVYPVQLHLANPYWEPCFSDTLIAFSAFFDTANVVFPVQPAVFCPFLETDIGVSRLRRCQNNTYTVRYCNTGTANASEAYVLVELDAFMSFVTAGLPGTEESHRRWRFDIGDIPAGYCGSFPLTVFLGCDAELGQTHCMEAHIYPDSLCITPDTWSGAEVAVEGDCYPDSVRFFIKNVGVAPTSLLDYIVIEDNIIYLQGQFQLPQGDSLPVALPANGSTWRVEAQQEPGSPGDPLPSATVEACGQNGEGSFSLGFVSQFGEDDGDPFVSIDCRANVASFDPNDKQAYPSGYGEAHYIQPGQPLDYVIRFQNTGTDTAFIVAVLDTLSAGLDPASVVPGASSHPYRFELYGPGILKFTFENILLPDSNVNEAASHGFVKFSVRQRADLPLGTVIQNRAAIYFDNNTPVLTNETWHTLGLNFVPVSTSTAKPAAEPALNVYPNPASRTASILTLKGPVIQRGELALYDWTGRPLLRRPVAAGNRIEFSPSRLPPGVYGFVVWENGSIAGRGKVALH